MSGVYDQEPETGPSVRHTVTGKEDGRAVGDILKNCLSYSRSLVRALKREGSVRVNGKPVLLNARVYKGDEVEISLPDRGHGTVLPEKIPLEIVFEDEDLLVVNKPPGMLVHPLTGEPSGTLANAVVHHWSLRGLAARFRPVYRIDRNTSGLVLVAANPFAYGSLARQLAGKTLRREYLAVAHGHLEPEQGRLCYPIGRADQSLVKREVQAGGKAAVTHYRVVERLPGGTVVKVSLETGRTHQIRVHFSHLGHPLYGDTLYGGSDRLIRRQALHAASLRFHHPGTGQLLSLYCDWPTDLVDLCSRLKKGGPFF